MKAQILRILRNSDGYVSGQDLCGLLGVSRTAVWKMIKQLKEEGYEIEAVSNRGYRIASCPDVVTEAEIRSLLPENSLFSHIYYYEEIGSTNDEARLLAEQGAAHGTLVVARNQTNGKGRRGRHWNSSADDGIWMSFVLRPDLEPVQAAMLTLVCAMAVSDGLLKHGVDNAIKWPNDIVIDGKKVCGILTEMSTQMEWINYVVAGIGINVHQACFPNDIEQSATSLAIKTNRRFHRAALIADVLTAFEHYYRLFIEKGDLSEIKTEYNARLINLNQCVKVIGFHKTEEGISRGIDTEGALLVEIDGRLTRVLSGEVSVRGVYGYV